MVDKWKNIKTTRMQFMSFWKELCKTLVVRRDADFDRCFYNMPLWSIENCCKILHTWVIKIVSSKNVTKATIKNVRKAFHFWIKQSQFFSKSDIFRYQADRIVCVGAPWKEATYYIFRNTVRPPFLPSFHMQICISCNLQMQHSNMNAYRRKCLSLVLWNNTRYYHFPICWITKHWVWNNNIIPLSHCNIKHWFSHMCVMTRCDATKSMLYCTQIFSYFYFFFISVFQSSSAQTTH